MSNKTVALDLDPGNFLWLKAQTLAAGRRSMSEILNQLIAKARYAGSSGQQEVKSIVGQARISEDDPDLVEADAAIRALFEESHDRFPAG